MASSGGYSVVPVQRIMFPLRIAQLILGLLVLGLSAYHVSLLWGIALPSEGIGIFTGIATLIFITYWLVATYSSTKLYNYWAIFAVELFVLIFWLCTFALAADFVASIISFARITVDDFDNFRKRSRDISGLEAPPVMGTSFALLAFSVLNFVLFAITFFIFTVNMFKHRNALREYPAVQVEQVTVNDHHMKA